VEHYGFVMSHEAATIGYYAERAGEYERIYRKPERQADLQTLRALVETAFTGADVLEVACGTGYWTELVARAAGAVVAIDINESVLSLARTKPIDAGRVSFERHDAYRLSSLGRRFTGGFSAFWWSHVPKAELRSFLTGFHGVLAPGSRVVFVDNVYVEGSSTPVARVDEQGDTFQRRALDNGRIYEVRKNFPKEAELRAVVEGLGQEIRVQWLRYYWVLSYVTAKPTLP